MFSNKCTIFILLFLCDCNSGLLQDNTSLANKILVGSDSTNLATTPLSEKNYFLKAEPKVKRKEASWSMTKYNLAIEVLQYISTMKCKLVSIRSETYIFGYILKLNETSTDCVLIEAALNGSEFYTTNIAVYLLEELCQKQQINKHMYFGLHYIIIPIVDIEGYKEVYTRQHDRQQSDKSHSQSATDKLHKYIKTISNIKLHITLTSGEHSMIFYPSITDTKIKTFGFSIMMAVNMRNVVNFCSPNSETQIAPWPKIEDADPNSNFLNFTLNGSIPYTFIVQTKYVIGKGDAVAFYEALKYAILQIQLTDLHVGATFMEHFVLNG